jgi:SAM-dependent methyltransferase
MPTPRLDECTWYHSMDLPGIGEVAGAWDLRGRFDDYVGHVALGGKSVLDVGTANGFLSFEAEKRGATVTSFDADGPERLEFQPQATEAARLRTAHFLAGMRNGYRLAHAAFGSRASRVEGNIYDLAGCAPVCDVVILGQILVHVRDALEALRQAALVAHEKLVIVEGSFEAEAPLAVFLGSDSNVRAWFHFSPPLYRRWLDLLGFELTATSRNTYRCLHEALRGDVEVWTFVAERRR